MRVYRKLEARGEIRGGRFIRDVGGEQFATSETVTSLRQMRDEKTSSEIVTISGADPANLIGIITAHKRVPSLTNNRIAFQNGIPLGAIQGDRLIALTRFADEIAPKLAVSLRGTKDSKRPKTKAGI